MKSIEEILAKNIRSRRKSLKMSQGELAKKAKISLHTVFRIEKCEQAPRRTNIEAIAGALGVSRETLYLDESATEKPTPTVSSLMQALNEMQKDMDRLTEKYNSLRANPLKVYAEEVTPAQEAFVKSYLTGSAVDQAREKLSQAEKKSRKS